MEKHGPKTCFTICCYELKKLKLKCTYQEALELGQKRREKETLPNDRINDALTIHDLLPLIIQRYHLHVLAYNACHLVGLRACYTCYARVKKNARPLTRMLRVTRREKEVFCQVHTRNMRACFMER